MMRAAALTIVLAFGLAAQAASPPDTSRVIVAGGALTAILYKLGAADHIVGVDTTSKWPPAVSNKPQVGYMRALSAEGVLSLSPTLVLTTNEAGPKKALQLIAATGVPVKQLPAPRSADAVRSAIRSLAALFDRPRQGSALVRRLDEQLEEARKIVASYAHHPRVLFLFSANGQLLAAGQDTAAAAIIKLAGGKSVTAFNGYKPLTPEAAIRLAPDVILAPDFVVRSVGSRAALLAKPALKLTPAGRNKQLVVMDGLRLLGFGPRLGGTVAELAQRLHQKQATNPPDNKA